MHHIFRLFQCESQISLQRPRSYLTDFVPKMINPPNTSIEKYDFEFIFFEMYFIQLLHDFFMREIDHNY